MAKVCGIELFDQEVSGTRSHSGPTNIRGENEGRRKEKKPPWRSWERASGAVCLRGGVGRGGLGLAVRGGYGSRHTLPDGRVSDGSENFWRWLAP
jgi:hypothetical protein